jgi:PKD repeat protein
MKTMLNLRRYYYAARVGILLIAVALVAGMVGCGGGGGEYNLTIASTTGGSVTVPGEATSTYNEGEVVDLVAEPEEGYHFVNWTGDVSSIADVNAASTTITMNDNCSITANFETISHGPGHPDSLTLECMTSPNPTMVGHETNFNAAASGGVGSYTWLWTMDGTPVITVGQNITHVFTAAGTYTVCVTVTDTLMNERHCCKSVTVNPA